MVSLGIATIAGVIVFLAWDRPTDLRPDFWQPWFGARSLLSGRDPYPLVGPGRAFVHEFPFLYPLTSSIAVLPLGLLKPGAATALFVAISTGLLAFGVTRDGWYRLPSFLSFPLVSAAWGGQWSPILTAAFCLPALAWLYAAKPTIGIALLIAEGSRKSFLIAAAGGSLLVVIGLVLVPQWPAEWLEALKSTGHMTPPILRPGGLVAFLALLRWRRPEARLIVALSCVPQSSHWYEVVPLLLVPATLLQSVAFSFSSSLPIIWEVHTGFGDGAFDLYPRSFQVALFAYLPAVIMVLRRPNAGELPASGSSSFRR